MCALTMTILLCLVVVETIASAARAAVVVSNETGLRGHAQLGGEIIVDSDIYLSMGIYKVPTNKPLPWVQNYAYGVAITNNVTVNITGQLRNGSSRPVVVAYADNSLPKGQGGSVFHVENRGAVVTLSNLHIKDNYMPQNFGGGLFAAHGTVNLYHCIFSGNAAKYGGAVYAITYSTEVEPTVRLTLRSCLLTKNEALVRGSAMYIGCQISVRMENTSITENVVVRGTQGDGNCAAGVIFSEGELIGDSRTRVWRNFRQTCDPDLKSNCIEKLIDENYCKRGEYAIGWASLRPVCAPCPTGFSCPFDGMYRAMKCPVGMYQSKMGQVTCKPCTRGQYCGGPDGRGGQEIPETCAINIYCDGTNTRIQRLSAPNFGRDWNASSMGTNALQIGWQGWIGEAEADQTLTSYTLVEIKASVSKISDRSDVLNSAEKVNIVPFADGKAVVNNLHFDTAYFVQLRAIDTLGVPGVWSRLSDQFAFQCPVGGFCNSTEGQGTPSEEVMGEFVEDPTCGGARTVSNRFTNNFQTDPKHSKGWLLEHHLVEPSWWGLRQVSTCVIMPGISRPQVCDWVYRAALRTVRCWLLCLEPR